MYLYKWQFNKKNISNNILIVISNKIKNVEKKRKK